MGRQRLKLSAVGLSGGEQHPIKRHIIEEFTMSPFPPAQNQTHGWDVLLGIRSAFPLPAIP